MTGRPVITVLLVDDSAIIRGLMSQALEAYPGITVAGRASNGQAAILMARDLQPDIIVLDIEMPVMDGITALPELVRIAPKSRIIIASTLTLRNAAISLQALSLGAADYLSKPTARGGGEVDRFYRELVTKICMLSGIDGPQEESTANAAPVAGARSMPLPVPAITPLAPGGRLNPQGLRALAIASSTGGPQALIQVFSQIKGRLRHIPIFVTQHMPATFTTILAEQLAKSSGHPAMEGRDGAEVRPGVIYVAPGDYHMTVECVEARVILRLNQNPPENFCRPAADPMLRSLAAVYGSHLLTAVLTGMGQDGMEGAREVVRHGGSVIAQDETSCVVYGMPKAVVDQGLCRAVLPLAEIAPFLIQQIEERA